MRRTLRTLALCALLPGAANAAGSLYDESTYRALTSDAKARRIGDVITVHVFENSSAETSTDTATQRKQNLNLNVGIDGIARQFGGTAGVGGTFDGGGTTQRANKLLATLTVTVREVLPSGDLRVAGEQLLTVNQEEHKVMVEGRIRPQDVSADNVVLSTRIAEARITFLGEGALSSRQKRPWWRSFLDFLGF